MENKNLTVSEAGAILMGAGLVSLNDVQTGLILIGAGVLLKVLVAILQKTGVPVSK